MFLRPTPPRLTRRSKLEHLWLLLLRCLALLLLAAGFARPFFSKDIALPTSSSEARQIVLLLDTSASMRREGVWNKARAVAQSYLDKSTPADQFAIMTFDRQPRTLVSFVDWSSWSADQRAGLARQRLAVINPGWMSTQLGLALPGFPRRSGTVKLPEQSRAFDQRFAEGAKLDGLQGHDGPRM